MVGLYECLTDFFFQKSSSLHCRKCATVVVVTADELNRFAGSMYSTSFSSSSEFHGNPKALERPTAVNNRTTINHTLNLHVPSSHRVVILFTAPWRAVSRKWTGLTCFPQSHIWTGGEYKQCVSRQIWQTIGALYKFPRDEGLGGGDLYRPLNGFLRLHRSGPLLPRNPL